MRKTRIGPPSPLRASPSRSAASSTGDRTPRAGSIVRESSSLSKASSGSRTPREGNSSPESNPLYRKGIRTSIKKPPNGTFSKASAVPKSLQSPPNGANTWNGRQAKQRPSLQADTFTNPKNSTTSSNFSRKNSIRQSLPRPSTGPQYDRNGRRIRPATSSLQSSPTKIVNPLLEQILQKVGHLQDDQQVVQKLQDFLRDYKGHGTTPGHEGDPTLDFTRAWIDGNGIVDIPTEGSVSVSPRKDPKSSAEKGNFSKIPAPIYKRPMSVASDSV